MIKNVLKEDFYRLKRSKAFWICFGIAAVLSLLAIMFLNMAFELVGSIVFEGSVSELLSPELMAAISFLNVYVPVFCMILAGVLVAGEFSHGTLRQILASGAGRVGVYFSKWLKVFVASAAIFGVSVIVAYLSGLIFWQPDSYYVGLLFADIGLELLSLAGFSALYVALAFMLRSIGGVIGVGIGLNLFVGMIINPLGTGVNAGGIFDVLNKLTLTGALSNATGDFNFPDVSAVLYAVFVPLCYVALFGVIGMLSFVKRDVK